MSGASEFTRRLDLLDDAVTGAKARLLMAALAQVGVDDTSENFESQADPRGRAWAPMAPLTRILKGANKNKIGINSGLMSRIAFNSDATHARWGSPLKYAYWFHFGRGEVVPIKAARLAMKFSSGALPPKLRSKGGNWLYAMRVGPQPARPFLGLGDRGWRRVRETIGNQLQSLQLGGSAIDEG